MENDGLTLDLGNTQTPQPETFSLDAGTPTAPMTEDRANRLSYQTKFGSPNYKRTYDEVYAALTSGQEDIVRNEVATQQNLEQSRKAQDTITELMGKAVAPVHPLEVQDAINRVKGPPADPATVIEKNYGYQYISELDQTASRNPFTIYSQFAQQDPVQALRAKDGGSTLVTQRAIAEDVLETAKERLKNQSWGDYILDQGKFLNPLYPDMKLRGLVNDRWFSGFGTNLLGTELSRQMRELNTISDAAEYKRRLSGIVERVGVDNPTLAVQIAESAVGDSTSTVTVNNMFNILDLFTGVQLGETGIKAGRSFVAGLRESADVRRAVRDTVRSVESTESPEVARSQGAGDIAEAAVKHASETALKDPTQKAIEPLLSYMKLNRIAITTDRGPAPVQRGFTRYFFGGEDSSATKIVHQSFDDATNHGASENIRYIDLPEGGKPSMELPEGLQADLRPYETRPAHSRNYRDLSERLVRQYDRFISGTSKVISEMNRVERIPSLLKVEAAMRAVVDEMKGRFPALSDHIIDIEPPVKNAITNSYDYAYNIGQLGGRHFEDRATAEMFGQSRLGNIQHTVEGEGATFYLKVTKPLPLNSDVVRDGLLASESAISPMRGAIKGYLSKFRTPDEIISEEHRLNRKAAVYSAAIFQKLRKSQEQYLQALQNGAIKTDPITGAKIARFQNGRLSRDARNARLDQWNRTVEAAKKHIHPETGEEGYWFRNPGELEDFYQQNFHRFPDDVEVQAYFAQKNLSDLDHAMRNWRVVTDMKNNGVEQFTIHALGADGKSLVSTQPFDGIRMTRLPSGDETILNVADHLEDSRVGILNKSGPKFTNDARKAVESGEKVVIRVWMPEKSPFSSFVEDPAAAHAVYALVPAARHEVKDIPWEQVPYREGGHFVYDAEHYIKQANVIKEKIGNVFRRRYLGDTTIAPIKIRAMGEDWASKLDKFREYLLAKDPEGAKAFLKANPIGVDHKEVLSWFNPKKDLSTGLIEPPLLNKEERIQVVHKNDNIWDMSGELSNKYKKGPGEIENDRKASLASQYAVEFTGKRDAVGLKTIINDGTATNPIYKLERSEFLDPIPVLMKSLNRIINSAFLDDYKMFAMEHWLQEAAVHREIMKDTTEQIRSAPFYFFQNGKFKPDAPVEVTRQMEAQREAIKNLLGKQSDWALTVQRTYDTLTDKIYKGEGIGGYTPQWLADWALPVATDPLSFFRTVAFHSKLGLFAVPQLLVQSASYVNMYAIAGLRPATMGSAAATFRVWDAINPAMRGMLDAKLSAIKIPGFEKYWWKPGEFTEATELLEKSGYAHVQGEHSFVPDTLVQSTIRNDFGRVLDAGQWFFRTGEKNNRHGSWYMAYKEFRAEHPTGAITDADLRSILDRADLLSGNMSRASGSILHQGVMASTAQFMAYQIRIAEQMWGTRLTPWERARMVAVNAAIYGVPAAGGLSGLPSLSVPTPFGQLPILGDSLHKAMIEHGYVPGEHWYSTLFDQGLPAMLGSLISGTTFDFGSRYGNWGFQTIRDAMRDDFDIFKMVGGAPYSVVANALSHLDPFYKSVQGYFTGNQFNLEKQHVMDLFTEQSGPNAFNKTLIALNTGKYFSNRGLYLDDVSPAKAMFMGLTGLKDARIDDQMAYRDIGKDMDKLQTKSVRLFVREYQRYLQALADKNPEQAEEYLTNTKSIAVGAGLPPHRELQIFKQAIDANRSLIDKVDWRFYGDPKNVPPGKEALYAKTYRSIQDMRKAQGKSSY